MEKYSNCPICNNDNIYAYTKNSDRHYGNQGEFNYDRCPNCKVVFLNPMFNDKELFEYYPEDTYYAYNNNFLDDKNVDKIEKNGKRVLDIGCGNGWTLYEFQKKGWEVAGVEPSKKACEIGNKHGLNIFNGTIIQANFPEEHFDFIRSNHSFEHIYNPQETIAESLRVLKKGGKIEIGVPNFSGINSKLFGKHWYYFGAPVHTFNYSPENLKILLSKYNFEIEEVKYVSGVLGLLGSIQILFNHFKGKRSSKGGIMRSKLLFYIAREIIRVQNFLKIGDCIEITAIKL